MVLSFGGLYDSKVVIIVERASIDVKKTGTRDGGIGEGVDRWVVWGVFKRHGWRRILVITRGVEEINFLRCIPQCICLFRIFITGHGEQTVNDGSNWSALHIPHGE